MMKIIKTLKVLFGGLVNAYSDYMTHYKARKSQSDESKFQAVTFDPTFLNRFVSIVNACTV